MPATAVFDAGLHFLSCILFQNRLNPLPLKIGIKHDLAIPHVIFATML